MKTIRGNLAKAGRILPIFTESLYKNMGYFLKNSKKFHPFIEEIYARLYRWYMFKVLSLLVY